MEGEDKAVLMEEALEASGLSAQETDDVDDTVYTDEAVGETTETDENGHVPVNIMAADEDGAVVAGDLTEGVIEANQEGYILACEDGTNEEGMIEGNQEDVEMPDVTEETSQPDDSNNDDDKDISSLEQGEEPMEVPDETLENSEDFSADQFISQSSAMIVQNEPPHQLMEEADTPGEVQSGEGDDASATENDEGLFSYSENAEEALPEEEDGAVTHQEGDLSESSNTNTQITAGESESEGVGQDSENSEQVGELPAESQTGSAADTMELPLATSGTASTDSAEGYTFLPGGNHIEGSLGGLEGKLVVGTDGTVHLLTGQESLQGIQLMEGDDKPEGLENGEDVVAQLQQDIQAQLQEALLKQEEIKQEEEERRQEPDTTPDDQPAESNDLATLASAALDHQIPANGVKSEPKIPEVKPEPDSNEPQWMDVGICKGTHCVVRTFYIPNENQSWDKNWEGVSTSTLPDHRALAKLELEAGKAYKFRVAAINSCGRGPWSEISAFRTSMPGVPGAPSAIKISKTVEGAHISWEPPSAASGVIEDYTVYMAVRSATTESQVVSSGATQLAFVRIYQGAENQCSVGFDTLSEAHIDTTTKPAILFRIAAKNEKGLGPAIQVRWLQDGAAPNAKPMNAPRRVGGDIKPHTSIKRKKSEGE